MSKPNVRVSTSPSTPSAPTICEFSRGTTSRGRSQNYGLGTYPAMPRPLRGSSASWGPFLFGRGGMGSRSAGLGVVGRTGIPYCLGMSARRWHPVGPFDDCCAVGKVPEHDLGAGYHPQIVAHPFRDRHPTIAGHLARHRKFQTVGDRSDIITSRAEGKPMVNRVLTS